MADPLFARVQATLAGRYGLERELRRGGMATVFLARDLNPQQPRSVAVKVLHPELATTLGVERFLREIQIAAGLTHPHILPLFDSGSAEGLLYFVMPYVDGETLQDRLEREPQLPVDEAVRIASDVAEALAYAHSRGVVHRDIKPGNILFAGGSPVVADFGIARAIAAARPERITEGGAIVGTVAYMSPEQASGDDELDGRSDIYSLGCVLYEMLTGSVPFQGATIQAVLVRQVLDKPAPLARRRPHVPEALERVVRRALAKTPADRFATAADLKAALQAPLSPRSADRQSVAVLPFANLSGDKAFEYLSDGVAEEIIMALAQLQGLRVAASTSSFAFRGKDFDLPEIGAKLGVATVLEGSVQKSGNRLRISARLAKVADGFALWSERYDREITDVFAIQDDIAKSIATGLQVTFEDWEGKRQGRPLVTPPTANVAAYDLYLKGRHQLAQRGLGLGRAVTLFEQAAALDPDYALAHAGVAEALVVLAQYGLVPPNTIRGRAHAAALRALELAPDLAEGHCALGALGLVCDWDWSRTSIALQRAVELNPAYITARNWLAFFLVFVEGRFDAGIAQAERAVELDPLAPLPALQLGMTLLGAGRYEAAERALRRVADLAPASFLPPLHLGMVYNRLGRTADAIASLTTACAMSGRHPWTLCALAVSHAALGHMGEVQAIHDELVARAKREYVQSAMLSIVTAALGRMDDAFALLQRACEEHDGILVYSKRYPFLETLQGDPRMRETFRRVGFPESP